MFLAAVEQDITHYLPMALARERLRFNIRFNISSSPVLSAFPLGSTTGKAQLRVLRRLQSLHSTRSHGEWHEGYLGCSIQR